MIPLPSLSLASWLRLGGALAFALLLAWGLRVDFLRALHLADLEQLRGEAGEVVRAVAEAAENPAATWADAPEQITALGNSRRALLAGIASQNARVDEMAREAVRLRAHAEELQRIASRAEAQRRAALRSLEDRTITPGHREDCEMLLAEANEALDLVREAGL